MANLFDEPSTMQLPAYVRDRSEVGGCAVLEIETQGWRSAAAGQFAMLRAQDSRCFLSRPYSIADQVIGNEGGARLTFVVSPVGVGSRELVAVAPGQIVKVTGPLGRGFLAAGLWAERERSKRLVIVAGGVGIAPMPLLLREIAELCGQGWGRPQDKGAGLCAPYAEVMVVFGVRSRENAALLSLLESGLDALAQRGVSTRVLVTSEDGSLGLVGLVTDHLGEVLLPGDRVVACGPPRMLATLWDVCQEAGILDVWVSLEAVMACGVGACHGCVIPTAGGGYARVCREGPVFPASVVFAAKDHR